MHKRTLCPIESPGMLERELENLQKGKFVNIWRDTQPLHLQHEPEVFEVNTANEWLVRSAW
jgi:hypothetical protein